MYEKFTAMAQGKVDYEVDVICINSPPFGMLMTVMASAEVVYITKEQAMKFFNLVEAP